MKLTLVEPKILKDSISIISELVTEGRFIFSPQGVELIAMDAANVAMVIFRLFSSSFVEYDVKVNTEITINLVSLKQIFKRIGGDDILSLEISSDNKLKILIKGKGQRTFYLPIIDSEEREQKVPDLNFLATIKMPCSMLSDAVEDVDIVADATVFIADENKLEIKAEGDLSKVNIEIPKSDDVKLIMKDPTEKIKSKYSIEYLKKMISGSKLSNEVVVNFGKDYPVKLDYRVLDKLELSFILAPRVEND
jgi:proliferating cell nuclear antigen